MSEDESATPANDDAPLPATEEESEHRPRRYAGNRVSMVDLEALLASGARHVPVQITPLDKVNVGYGEVPAKRPPSLVIIDRVSPSGFGPKARQIHYYNLLSSFSRSYADLALGHEVTVLTGRQGADMVARFQKYREEHFELPRGQVFSGSDPEVFIVDAKGEVIPAFHFLPSKKDNKQGHGSEGVAGNYYWDGFQAEFNTRPGQCLVYHADSLYAGLFTLAEAAKGHNKKARLSIKSVVTIPQETLDASSEEHVAFGCMPSLNAYDLAPAQSLDGRSTPLRFAGGHIHFGVGKIKNHRDVVKALDAVLGVAAVSLFATLDNPVRRQFYGLPGEYRLPPHGLEYRTLSNAWLCHPAVYHMVFDLARRAKDLGQQGMGHMWKAEERETIETIISCDVPRARAILERNKGVFKTLLSCLGGYNTPEMGEAAYGVWANGVETLVEDPTDIHHNWRLDSWNGGHCVTPAGYWGAAYAELSRKKKV